MPPLRGETLDKGGSWMGRFGEAACSDRLLAFALDRGDWPTGQLAEIAGSIASNLGAKQ